MYVEGGSFEYGLNFPVFKSSVTSRKLTTFLLASMVIRGPFFANTLNISFFHFFNFMWGLI